LKNSAGALKLPIAAYYRPSGKNVNRYPASKDSDDWGVIPDQGYEIASEELQLAKAREYVEAQLNHR
jgi:carboxyl-terminal processing protease